MKKSIGYRIFLVRGDDALPLSKTTFEEFLFGRRAVLQNFAGQTIDIATVVCRLENKKPKEIVRFYCQRFKVKSDGSIDQAHNQKRSVPAATLDRALVRNTINREKTGDPIDPSHGRRLAHSLVMISRAAQKKINEVLWR
ncbi:MAG: hypothetical protein M3496_06585 [Pseudomonadota bacterium]|nr:hypothetical protein [Pseudomonadota bacterium]